MIQRLSFFGLVMVMAISGAVNADEAPEAKAEKGPRIEVVFVLDTTGSMSGLIEGAKQKIWSITNEIVSAKPTPRVRLGLIGYRDRGDEYITRRFDLTDDVDAIYSSLMQFTAAGGGDGPESVNQALHEAVHEMAWSDSAEVLKIIFLVGDAPPHMDYDNDVHYPLTCEAAVKKDLIINAIQCGSDARTRQVWQEIAQLSEGTYVAIAQTGGVVSIPTPMDEELARLTREMNGTVVPYGLAAQQAEVRGKVAQAATAPASATADRAHYFARSEGGRAVTGRGDLVVDVQDGVVDEDALAQMPAEQLPEPMQAMDVPARQAHLAELAAQRAAIQEQVVELSRQREAYLAEKRRELGEADGFDAQVARAVRAQAARKGIVYE